MKTISWGTKIMLLYASFVLLVLTMVYFSMQEKVELVSSDYYAQELQYQQRIKQMNNANALSSEIAYKQQGNHLLVFFPAEMKGKKLSGKLLFFKPSDVNKDKAVALMADSAGTQDVDMEQFARGMYKAKVSWSDGTCDYYNEQTIVLK